MWQLQTALNDESDAQPLLILDKNWVHFNLDARLWLDVHEFDHMFAQVCDIPGRRLSGHQVQKIKEIIPLYQGDLLIGWYQNWCAIERERFQSILLALLDKLIDYCLGQGLYEKGVVYAMRVLRYDQARERTHRLLMRLYYLAGDRTAALRQFEQCTAVLAAELDVKPTRSTQNLYTHIRQDQLPPEDETPVNLTANGVPPSQVADGLKAIQKHLALLEHDVKILMQRLGSSD